jgi:acetolactate synthase-1/3 small subunit
MTGASDKLDAFLQVLDQGLIIEVVRSGVSGIGRGDRSLKL